MLSYRITDSGAKHLGGDGGVVKLQRMLQDNGYTVFVGERCAGPALYWARLLPAELASRKEHIVCPFKRAAFVATSSFGHCSHVQCFTAGEFV